MSLDPSSVIFGEIDAVIAATWPEVISDGAGTYEIEQAQALSDEQIKTQGGWPYAVYDLPEGAPAEYGIVNAVMRSTLSVRWVDQNSVNSNDVRAKLRLLAKAMLAATFTGMTVEEVESIGVHPSEPAESIFLNKNSAFVCGRLGLTVVYGETALG